MRGVGVNTSSYVPPTPTGAAPTATRYEEIYRAEFDAGSDVTHLFGFSDTEISTGVSFAGRDNLLEISFLSTSFDSIEYFTLNDANTSLTAGDTLDGVFSYYIHDPENQIESDDFDILFIATYNSLTGNTFYQSGESTGNTVKTIQTNQWDQIVCSASVSNTTSYKFRFHIPTVSVSSASFDWKIYFSKVVIKHLV